MRKIKDVLRLKLDAKLSHQRIATALGISKGVVSKYVGLAAAVDLDWRPCKHWTKLHWSGACSWRRNSLASTYSLTTGACTRRCGAKA
jgi:hypothetical protein